MRCEEKVRLTGFASATSLVRSLVCKCEHHKYIPRTKECVSLYRTAIVEPLVQRDIPLIIKDIARIAKKYPCEGIQIYIDNISNVYHSCIAGALQFQGDAITVS